MNKEAAARNQHFSHSTTIIPSLKPWLNKFLDLLSSHFHSEDFKQTRRNLVLSRLRLMCLFFAISVPASSVFDVISLGDELTYALLPLRLALSLLLLCIYYLASSKLKDRLANSLISIAFILPIAFFLAVELVFAQYNKAVSLTLAITPFLNISMLGLFPLTLRFGAILFCSISALLFCFHYFYLHYSAANQIQLIWQLSLFGGVAIWLQLGQLSMLMKLYRESTIDPLTDLINRRVLMRQLRFACVHSELTSKPCCLMILDLDRFKRINDEYGHQSGDRLLTAFANILNIQAESKDTAARFGGEEFVLLMPNTSIEQAIHKAQRISQQVRDLEVLSDSNQVIKITASIGIGQFTPGLNPESLIKQADDLLYQAKQAGRDCIKH